MDTAYSFLADELERLLKLPLESRADLDSWYVEARKLEMAAKTHALELPEEVWHFLADADIRSRPHETEYREVQERTIVSYIEALRGRANAS